MTSEELARHFEALNRALQRDAPHLIPLAREIEQAVAENRQRIEELERMLHA